MKEIPPKPKLFKDQYNSRSYDERGWCVFEDCVSRELTTLLSAYPKMTLALAKLPPKMLVLRTGKPAVPGESRASESGDHVAKAISRIEAAVFTGAADKPKVVALYRDYVARIAGVLEKTLSLGSSFKIPAEDEETSLPLPKIDTPPVPSLQLVPGQFLLIREKGISAAAMEGLQFAVGHESGVARRITGGYIQYSFDYCNQEVLPWEPKAGWERSVLDLLTLGLKWRRIGRVNQGIELRNEALAKALLAKQEFTAAEWVEFGIHSLRRDHYISSRGSYFEPAVLKSYSLAVWEPGTTYIAPLHDVAVKKLRESGGLGVRRYESGQLLWLRIGKKWHDGVVDEAGEEHCVRYEAGRKTSVALHPWNHAPRQLPLEAFESILRWYTQSMRAKHKHVLDALSGRRLDTLEQCVAVQVEGRRAGYGAITDVRSLSSWLCSLHAERRGGVSIKDTSAALLTGPPASGKTTMVSQVMMLVLEDVELVPIIIKVQMLHTKLLEKPEKFDASWNWFDAYLQETNPPMVYRCLRQLMMARRALLLLDGLDEGGALRSKIEEHVLKVLAPQGHVLLCTSRPAGIDEEMYSEAGLHLMNLSPLSEEQQRHALVQRLGSELASKLIHYVAAELPLDREGNRVTSNPLMLSMVASVFEIRRGTDMPATTAGLYEIATDAMITRGGTTFGNTHLLLQAVFFEAQKGHQRELDLADLESSVRTIGGTKAALDELQELMLKDKMPLISLLIAKPLKVQSSHLSFQEYFAARAICEDSVQQLAAMNGQDNRLSMLPPWKWTAWWANVLTFGIQMGDSFLHGLLRAAGVTGDVLDLGNKLGGHPPTVHQVVAELSKVLISLNLASNEISPDGAIVIAEALKFSPTLALLNLADNRIGPSGSLAIADALNTNAKLTELNLSQNWVGPKLGLAMFDALRINSVLTSLDLSCNVMRDEGGIAIAEALKVNRALHHIDLSHNYLCSGFGVVIAKALKQPNLTRMQVKLGDNMLGDKVARDMKDMENVYGIRKYFVDDG